MLLFSRSVLSDFFATLWIVASKAPLSMALFRQEYCHFLLQGNLPNPGIEPGSPALQEDSLTSELIPPKSVNLRVVKFVRIKSRMVTSQGLAGGWNGELVFSGHRVTGWDDEKILETDDCTTM